MWLIGSAWFVKPSQGVREEDGIEEEELDLLEVDIGAASNQRQGRPQGEDRPPLEVAVTSGEPTGQEMPKGTFLLLQSLSDIVTTSDRGQNSHNIQ